MTKKAFIKRWCKVAKITEEEFHAQLVAVPCSCDYKNCKGWVAEATGDTLVSMRIVRSGLL